MNDLSPIFYQFEVKIKIYQLQIQLEIIIIPEMSYGVKFRKQANTDLYKLYNTNLHEKIEMMKKEKHQ